MATMGREVDERGKQQQKHVEEDEEQIIIDKMEARFEKQEDKILKLESSVFQLANYYFVFSGVILSAIISTTGSNSFKCRYAVFPFLISSFGAILNFSALRIITNKYVESLKELDEKTSIWVHTLTQASEKLYRSSTSHEHRKSPGNISYYQQKWNDKEYKKKNRRRKINMYLSLGIFLSFVIILLVAIWVIPCRSGN